VAAEVQNVTKEVFLTACRTAGWFIRHKVSVATPTPGEALRMEEGQEVHRRARTLFPQGISGQDRTTAAAAKKTTQLMADPSVTTIFEATFHVDGYSARADVIQRVAGAWHLVEIKSDVEDKPELVDDLAYTAMVAVRCGIRIAKASLLLLSKEFRLGMGSDKLFVMIDHTSDMEQKVRNFLLLWDDVSSKTKQPNRPSPNLMLACRSCPFFEADCLGRGINDHIFDLPRLSQKKFDELAAEGVVTIHEIPAGSELTDTQERVRRSVISGQPSIAGSLAGELAAIVMPAYYLDFETVMTALPLYPAIAPYTQIPTQYSVHVCSNVGKVTGHREFLADPARDCRRELAQQLITDLGTKGSVISYSSFEKTTIRALAAHFPDLKNPLAVIVDRIVDLEAILRRGYYHPGFHGRTSIKVTLPVMVPNMSYEGLEIGDGDTAVAMFARMAKGQVEKRETERIRKALLAYCKQDTLAMVKLHEQLTAAIA